MIEDFHSKEELYQRVYPALESKIEEWAEEDITEKMIWDFLSTKKWINGKNLTLYDIVNDIFKLNLEDFLKEKTEGE